MYMLAPKPKSNPVGKTLEAQEHPIGPALVLELTWSCAWRMFSTMGTPVTSSTNARSRSTTSKTSLGALWEVVPLFLTTLHTTREALDGGAPPATLPPHSLNVSRMAAMLVDGFVCEGQDG